MDIQVLSPEEKLQYAKNDAPKAKGREPEVLKEAEPPRRERDASPALKEPPRHNRVKKDIGHENRNDNILCAVLALVKELDEHNLDIIKKEIDRKLAGR